MESVDRRVCHCNNCEWTGTVQDVYDATGFGDVLQDGDPMPICHICGADEIEVQEFVLSFSNING